MSLNEASASRPLIVLVANRSLRPKQETKNAALQSKSCATVPDILRRHVESTMGDSRPTETDSGIKGFITNADRVFQRRGAPSLSVRSEAVKPVTARPPGATPNQFSTEALRKLSVLGGDVITFRKKDVPLSLKTPSVRLFRSQRIIQILNSGLGLCQCFQCFPQTEENHPHFNRAWRRDCDYTPPPRVYTDAGLNL